MSERTSDDEAVTIHDGTRWVARRITPTEAERLQGFPTIVHLEVEKMTADELIACALANGDIFCDFETGKVFGTRGPGGVKLSTPRELGFRHPTGYIHINLSANGVKKQVRVHRVIYIAAHGGIPDGMVIDHINGIKDDNRLCNLQAMTTEDNSHKAKADGAYLGNSDPAHNKRMVPYEIRADILYSRAMYGLSYSELAEMYGCSKSTVRNIIHENGYTDIGEWVDSKGKTRKSSDTVRFKALGNSMCVNVMAWIGRRIKEIEDGTEGKAD